MGSTRHTILSIQVLRFVAASLVVAHHSYQAMEQSPFYKTDASWSYLLAFGAVGVHVFFVISGYIIYLTSYGGSHATEKHRVTRYMYRRIVRVFPVYWIFFTIYVLVRYLIGQQYSFTPIELSGSLLLWPEYSSKVIGPAWTLSFEVFFYICFGVSMLFGKRKGPIILSSFFLACIAIGYLLHPTTPSGHLATNALLLEFIVGIWIARITTACELPRPLGIAAITASLTLFGIGLLFGYDRLPLVVSWGPPSALLVFGLIAMEKSAPIAGTKWLSRLGNSSYSLYLSHILLIDLVMLALHVAGLQIPALVAVALIVVVAVTASHGFYLLIERHVVRGLQRLVA